MVCIGAPKKMGVFLRFVLFGVRKCTPLDLSPCNFVTTHFPVEEAALSLVTSPFNFATHEMEDQRVATPQKSTKINFWGPEIAGWGGDLPLHGW